jgi:CBS domain-containing protein
MAAPASATLDQEVRAAAELMISRDLRSLPVTDGSGAVIGLLDEHEVAAVALGRHDLAEK